MKNILIALAFAGVLYYILKKTGLIKFDLFGSAKDSARKLIVSLEGCSVSIGNGNYKAYNDAGDAAIGYGSHHYADGSPVSFGDVRNKAVCDAALNAQIDTLYNQIQSNTHVPLSNNQTAALISFGYNVGSAAMFGSTLWNDLQSGMDKVSVADQFSRWVYSQGAQLPALVERRKREQQLFLS